MKAIATGELRNFNIKKEMGEIKIGFDISQLTEVIKLSIAFGAKPIKMVVKVGDKVYKIGNNFVAKSLNTDLKKGYIQFTAEATLDDIEVELETLRVLQNIESKFKFEIDESKTLEEGEEN